MATTIAPAATNVRTRRPHPAVGTAIILTLLVASFGAYGSIYFSGIDGFSEADLTFLVVYLFMSGTAMVSAVAFARRRPLGRSGVVLYALWLTAFNVFKVGYVREQEAVVFLVVGLAVLALALSRAARAHVTG